MHSLCRGRWNNATYKWQVHIAKIEDIFFVDFKAVVQSMNGHRCICVITITYFISFRKPSGIDQKVDK